MKIKLPFAQIVKLITDLIRYLPHGVTPEEGHQLVQDMLAIAMPLLHQVGGGVLPGDITGG